MFCIRQLFPDLYIRFSIVRSVMCVRCLTFISLLFSLCSTKLDLRFSLALCDKEKLFRQSRRERVMLGIKKLLDMEKPRFLPSAPEEVGTNNI